MLHVPFGLLDFEMLENDVISVELLQHYIKVIEIKFGLLHFKKNSFWTKGQI